MEMKKNRLQAELERMELDEHIAESEAKLKVFDSFYVGPERHSTVQETDGMNEYLTSQTSHIAKTSLHRLPGAQIPALALDPSEPAPLLRTSEPPRSESSEESDSSSHSKDLITVIQRQNDIADLLILHQK